MQTTASVYDVAESSTLPAVDGAEAQDCVLPLKDFINAFGEGLLETVRRQNPPVYEGEANGMRAGQMHGLKREPFARQRDVVQAVTRLLVDLDEPAAIINGEMGTGKVRRIGA